MEVSALAERLIDNQCSGSEKMTSRVRLQIVFFLKSRHNTGLKVDSVFLFKSTFPS